MVTGCILHLTDGINSDGNYEVDLQFKQKNDNDFFPMISGADFSSRNSWVIKHSDIGGIAHRSVVRNFSCVRFFHEKSGYLNARKTGNVKMKNFGGGMLVLFFPPYNPFTITCL